MVVDAGAGAAPPSVLVLNKVDALPRPPEVALGAVGFDLRRLFEFDAWFGVSALRGGRGLEALQTHLLAAAVARPWELPAERATDRSRAAQALEVTRQAMFERLHEELPYTVRIRHLDWRQLADGSVRVEQALVVRSNAQRRLVVGTRGATVGQLGIAARRRLEALLGCRVHLFLRVKVADGSEDASDSDALGNALLRS